MENVTIVLKLEGKEKKFVTPDFISGVHLRKAAEIANMIETSTAYDGNDFDAMISFVCEQFDHKFTIEEFEEGTDARKLLSTIYGVANFVMNNVELASQLLGGDIEKDAEGKST